MLRDVLFNELNPKKATCEHLSQYSRANCVNKGQLSRVTVDNGYFSLSETTKRSRLTEHTTGKP